LPAEDVARHRRDQAHVRQASPSWYGTGGALLDRLVTEARASGFERIRLDSARFMETAHALYRSRGFVDIDAYPESEIPDEIKSYWVFMERELD